MSPSQMRPKLKLIEETGVTCFEGELTSCGVGVGAVGQFPDASEGGIKEVRDDLDGDGAYKPIGPLRRILGDVM